jgi:hypothetical protein
VIEGGSLVGLFFPEQLRLAAESGEPLFPISPRSARPNRWPRLLVNIFCKGESLMEPPWQQLGLIQFPDKENH